MKDGSGIPHGVGARGVCTQVTFPPAVTIYASRTYSRARTPSHHSARRPPHSGGRLSCSLSIGVSKKSEHFRRWQHFLRYLVTHGYSYIHLVRTYEMHANALTKVDNKDAFFKFCKIAMNY